MADFRMPSLGADMESATLTEWMVKPGDAVARGDIVASVETEKGIIDIEVFDTGTVEALLVEPGTKVAVGAVLASIRREGEEHEPAAPAAAPPAGIASTSAPPERPSPAAPAGGATRRSLSPAARRRVREVGLAAEQLEQLHGTGPSGAITVADVERAAGATGAVAQEQAPPRDMRSVIGQAMSRSKREIPHYYLATTIDMTPAVQWLEEWNARHTVPERLLYGVLLIKAVALALEQVPELNGFWTDGRFRPSDDINVGMAIRLRQGGLIAPGIDSANRKGLPELMSDLQGLVQRARSGHLRRHEITNATITVSSLGEGNIETVFPIIYPPQVAIVGFGSIVNRPWVSGGQLCTAPLVHATLSGDHRTSDGHRGSFFLAEVDRLLQRPDALNSVAGNGHE